jgi:hypothetical protein
MKRFASIALLTLATVCAAGRLQAQTREMRADIPFNFIVGSQQLQAGSYRLLPEGESIILIQNRDHATAVLTLRLCSTGESATGSSLVFNKYGDRYFLSEIHSTISALNQEIPRSKLEKRAQTEQASLEPTRIMVAGN